MKALLIIATLAVTLTGCGELDRGIAQVTGWSKVCVDGVTYLQFPSGVTAQVDRQGRPVVCGQ